MKITRGAVYFMFLALATAVICLGAAIANPCAKGGRHEWSKWSEPFYPAQHNVFDHSLIQTRQCGKCGLAESRAVN